MTKPSSPRREQAIRWRRLVTSLVAGGAILIYGIGATMAHAASHGDGERPFMIAAANPLAAAAGRSTLAAGGSAADAAVATQMVLTLVEPQSSGTSAAELSPCTGTLPSTASPPWMDANPRRAPPMSAIGCKRTERRCRGRTPLAVGARSGFREPWSTLLQPAQTLAAQGFAISPRLAASIAKTPELSAFPVARTLFLTADSAPKPSGATLRNPALAHTLSTLATAGTTPFYHGALARDLVAAARSAPNPSLLTMSDLSSYAVVERPPVCAPGRTGSAAWGRPRRAERQ